MRQFGQNAGATEGGSAFEINYDWTDNRARVVMVTPDGVELFIALPIQLAQFLDAEEVRAALFKECEVRLRDALLSLIAKNWPKES